MYLIYHAAYKSTQFDYGGLCMDNAGHNNGYDYDFGHPLHRLEYIKDILELSEDTKQEIINMNLRSIKRA
jgi:hypothetical protein